MNKIVNRPGRGRGEQEQKRGGRDVNTAVSSVEKYLTTLMKTNQRSNLIIPIAEGRSGGDDSTNLSKNKTI